MPLNILIADDEAPARNRMRDLLSDIEHVAVVAEAKNGKEAIDLALQTKPDLMLLDIRMPVMDGIEAAQHAQKIEPKPNIIFTTAFDAYAIEAFMSHGNFSLTLSGVISQVVYWLVIILFIITGANSLGLNEVAGLLQQLASYLRSEEHTSELQSL